MAQRGPYRDYTAEEKAQAFAALQATGGRTELVSVATGIPRQTLNTWQENGRLERSVSRLDAEVRRKSEQELENRLERVALKGLNRLQDDDIRQRATVQQAAIATGVHMDLTGFMRSAGYVEVIDTKLLPSGGSEGTADEETDPDDGGG